MKDTRTGVDRIAAERERQISEKGWSLEHDDDHYNGEIAGAAASYAEFAHRQIASAPSPYVGGPFQTWRWAGSDWKPSGDPVRNLEKAGALIAAEIDRLLREREDQPDYYKNLYPEAQ